MHVITSIAEMQDVVSDARAEHMSIGFVPTMGALHIGHAELINTSSIRHALTVVSIFVNPLQFGPHEDFSRYPRDLESDIKVIREHGGTHAFAPSTEEMYSQNFATTVHVAGITSMLEGAARPDHFDGVATVVCKLLNIVMPTDAYFGQKDYQQTLVVRRLVKDLALPINIEIIPTVRDEDGLAVSSRNRYLSVDDREKAVSIYRALTKAKNFMLEQFQVHHAEQIIRTEIESVMQTELDAVNVDYAVAVEANTLIPHDYYILGNRIALLIAARVGTTRLIDNEIVALQ